MGSPYTHGGYVRKCGWEASKRLLPESVYCATAVEFYEIPPAPIIEALRLDDSP